MFHCPPSRPSLPMPHEHSSKCSGHYAYRLLYGSETQHSVQCAFHLYQKIHFTA
jgi:hypothetical protein